MIELTIKSKKLKLEELKDEVADVHPLLHSLLPKLPLVEYLEYTHGPNEKGADFVLLRKEMVLGTAEYVGVIAKRGDISKNLNQQVFCFS